MNLGQDLAANVQRSYGADGEAWLRGLPGLIEVFAARWGLRLGDPFPGLSYNYVAPAVRRDGSAAVLKLGFPHADRDHEIEALRRYAGDGCASLLSADPSLGAILIERLQPGHRILEALDDEAATSVAAALLPRLWRPLEPGHGFPEVAAGSGDLARARLRFDGGTGPLAEGAFRRAEEAFTRLGMVTSPVLLHGDLHHFNILSAEREPWLAIDPHGSAGDPAWDCGAWMRNPTRVFLAAPGAQGVTNRRIRQFARLLGFDAAWIRECALAQAVQNCCWDINEGRPVDAEKLTVVQLLANADA